jgi:uncharacterized membrane protein
MNTVTNVTPDKTNIAMSKVIYGLYLFGIIMPLAAVVGVIMAYVFQSDASGYMKSHYQLQIRTFWIGFLYLFIAGLLSAVIIGFFIALLWLVWLIVRCVRGFKALENNQPYPNPTGWFF